MLDKQQLIDLFRSAHGMERFATARCNLLSIPAPVTPAVSPVAQEVRPVRSPPPVVYQLSSVMLGSECWFYVQSQGHVIVPPFKWSPLFDDASDMLDRARF